MKFLIHYSVKGVDDSILIEGTTIEELRETATVEMNKRGATDMWSEEVCSENS
jgi:hypothetical protein